FFRDSKLPKYDLFYKIIRTAANYTSDIKWRNYNTGY
ncbi:DDE transposase, partial [Bacteroides stercoris]